MESKAKYDEIVNVPFLYGYFYFSLYNGEKLNKRENIFMKYDFTSILDRKGKDAIAIDAVGAQGAAYPAPRAGFDVIPMWIADMNFPVVPTIQHAMIRRPHHPAFGCFAPTRAYYHSIIQWP